MMVHKVAPGHYSVWLGSEYLVFNIERDAQRFAQLARSAKKRSWEQR